MAIFRRGEKGITEKFDRRGPYSAPQPGAWLMRLYLVSKHATTVSMKLKISSKENKATV